MSNSFHDAAAQRAPDSRISIDLGLFWEIIESSFVSELPAVADCYFGVSLTSHRQASQSGEVLRKRLLPEPTRLHAEDNANAERSPATWAMAPADVSRASNDPAMDFNLPLDEDASILAQSYFAQGQDFVGSLDDWLFLGQPT